MKNRITSLFLATMLLLGTLVSCKESGQTDENGTAKPNPTTSLPAALKMSAVDSSVENFTVEVSVDPEAEISRYLVGVVTKDDFTANCTEYDKVAPYFVELVEARGAACNRADNRYIFSGDRSITLGSYWELEYETEYVVVAVGVSSSGEATTKVAKLTATTTAAPPAADEMLKITTANPTASNIEVSVEMSKEAPFDLYFVAPISRYDFEEYFGNNKVKVVSALIQSVTAGGGSLAEANGYFLFNRSTKFDIGENWDLESDSEYLIFAFGVDDKGSLEGEIETEVASTIPYEDGYQIELSDVEPAAYNIKLHATPESKVENYCVFAISDSDVAAGSDSGSDFELAKYVRDYLYFIGTNFAKADGVFIFNGEADVDISKMIRLSSSTPYTIIAFGLTADGKICTPVSHTHTETLKNPTLSGELKSIEIVGNDSRSFDVAIDKGTYSGYYYVGVYPKEWFDSFCKGNAYTLAEMFMEDAISLNSDFTIVDDVYIFDKSTTYNTYYSWICRPDTEYVVMAFGVDFAGTISSNVIYTSGKTDPVVMSENEISLSVHGVTSNSATLKATTTNDDIYYITNVKKSVADKMSDQELVDYLEVEAGVFFAYMVSKGDDIIPTGPTLKPSTDYYAVAYGWDMALSTEVHKVPFTTLANVDAPAIPSVITIPDVDFGKLSVTEIDYESYHLKVTPNDEDGEYMLITLLASDLESFKSDEDIVKAVLNAVNNSGKNYEEGGDIYDAWGDYVKPLPTDIVQRAGVSSGYSYATVVFGIDKATLQPTTECLIKRFTILNGAPAAAPATPQKEFSCYSPSILRVK